MYASALFFQVLLATAAFAVPTSRERFAQRLARRSAGAHLSHPRVPSTLAVSELSGTSNVTNAEFSTNWSGAVMSAGANTFKSVTGTFTIPTPREPSGQTSEHSASAWVGIDGDTCGTAILQTGIDFTVTNGRTSFDAWFEWFPDFAHDFTGISLAAGNSITVSVTATSRTGGTATIVNHSTGQTVSHTFSGQPALCEQDAEWIVEDFEEGNSLVPLANWGTVTFTGATANGAAPSGATIINMEQNGRVLTSASTSGSTVTVAYTGP
ncbi:aspergillopepsin [Trametes versicolor FP-101664 SS1]|uniref:aspergillopepsin n=1 Tax=Trametes versicolor (strain FP-101664) TaxID=717944 RepID=UPI0004621E2C|nr:aspergillopepsin [Trametes versicolor FP-101664 SS1]EIW52514.1 aspergillopepsin [Trametes versicolor FP-101664 SS1]